MTPVASAGEPLLHVTQPPADDDSEDEDDDEDANNGRAGLRQAVAMNREQVEQWVYSNLGGSKAAFEQNHRMRVKTLLNQYDQLCHLSDEQKQKVTATADLEAQRVQSDIDAVINGSSKRADNQVQQELFQKAWAIAQKFQTQQRATGTLGNSLWQKVLRTQLNDEQLKLIAEDEKKRAEMKRKVQYLETILQLQRKLGLSAKQREELLERAQKSPDSFASFTQAWAILSSLSAEDKQRMFTRKQIESLNKQLEQAIVQRMIIMEQN